MVAYLRRAIAEGNCSNLCVGLLSFRLFAVGIAGIALLNEYPPLSVIALCLGAATLLIGVNHQQAVPVLHIIASSIWAGAAVTLFLNGEWWFGTALILLSVLETTIASIRVRSQLCNT